MPLQNHNWMYRHYRKVTTTAATLLACWEAALSIFYFIHCLIFQGRWVLDTRQHRSPHVSVQSFSSLFPVCSLSLLFERLGLQLHLLFLAVVYGFIVLWWWCFDRSPPGFSPLSGFWLVHFFFLSVFRVIHYILKEEILLFSWFCHHPEVIEGIFNRSLNPKLGYLAQKGVQVRDCFLSGKTVFFTFVIISHKIASPCSWIEVLRRVTSVNCLGVVICSVWNLKLERP